MTWSILARDPRTGAVGVACASRFFALGAVVPHGRGGVGVVATQALVNPLYGSRGLKLLAQGLAPAEAVERLVIGDAGAAVRQLHLLDAAGRNAAHTGADCVGWAGHRIGEGVSIAGNMLTGREVVEATLETYQALADRPFGQRLIAAMAAGDDAGGDKRGKQSAALKMFRDQAYPLLDLRVDDHPEPIQELRRLYEVAHERYLGFARAFATDADPVGLTDREEIEHGIEAFRAALLADPSSWA